MPSTYLILSHPLLLTYSLSQHQGLFQWVGSFPMSRLFISRGQSIGVSALASVLIQDWFPLGWTGWIVLLSKGLSRVFSSSSKASILRRSAFFIVHLSHPYMTTGKTIVLTAWTFVSKVMFLLFNALSRFVIAFLLRNKHLLISWLQSLSTVILEPKKIKSVTVFIVTPSICHEVMVPDAIILVFWRFGFKPAFFQSPFPLIKRVFSSSLISAISVVSLIFLLAILIPACNSSSLAFCMITLHKQDDNISLEVFLFQFGTNLLFHVQF